MFKRWRNFTTNCARLSPKAEMGVVVGTLIVGGTNSAHGYRDGAINPCPRLAERRFLQRNVAAHLRDCYYDLSLATDV